MAEHDINHDRSGMTTGTTYLRRSGISTAVSQNLIVSKGNCNTLTLIGYNTSSFYAAGFKEDGTYERIYINTSTDTIDLTNYLGCEISFFSTGTTTATLS